jgi:hypothetical protein
MKQETAIAAPHHAEPEADEADRAIPQIVSFPAALGDTSGTKKNVGNLAVGGVLVPSIDSPQSEDEPIPACPRQHGGTGTRVTAGQAAPEPDGGSGTDLKQLVERQEDGGRFRTGFVDMDAKHGAMMLAEMLDPIGRKDGPEGEWWKPKAGIGKVSRKPRQGNHTWQSLCCPQNRGRAACLDGARKIAPPSAG